MPCTLRNSYIYNVFIGAKLGKENDEASEEEASDNKNGTDGEQLSLDEGDYTNRLPYPKTHNLLV